MQISIDRSDRERLSFTLTPDETDAVPPLPEVSFRGEHLNKVRPDRLALMAYLIAKPFIGNELTLVGAGFPAYMAAAIREDFAEHELFPSPLENQPKRIVFGEARLQEWAFCTSSQPQHQERLSVCRTPYGYNLSGFSQGSHPLRSNLRFFCSFSESEAAGRERGILAVMICDVFDAYRLVLEREESSGLTGILNLLSLVGMSRAD
ncbi:MAG: hypothetical protein M9905_10930 [Rhizobiaceae bacterium]|nr:hypothetical protein [Rhizobiaceae bacterium]